MILDGYLGCDEKAVEKRFRELLNARSLSQLREQKGKTQQQVAQAMKINQPSVAKIEKREDMYLSTIQAYIFALGGRLKIVADFDGEETEIIT